VTRPRPEVARAQQPARRVRQGGGTRKWMPPTP
jgi:hypothetical protein